MSTIDDVLGAFLATDIFPLLEGTMYWDDICELISNPHLFDTYADNSVDYERL